MPDLSERRFVLRKKSEGQPTEKPKEDPKTDEVVEPERLLSVQGVDLSEAKVQNEDRIAESKGIREYIPEKKEAVTDMQEPMPRRVFDPGKSVPGKYRKQNLTRFYR